MCNRICPADRDGSAACREGWLVIVPCLFYTFPMQMAFGFGAVEDVEWVRDRLRSRFGRAGPIPAMTPVDQLVKSSISGRTRDEISWGAYRRLVETYPEWSEVAGAEIAGIEAVIGDVTYPDVKARYLRDALRIVAAYRPDFDLAFLGGLSVTDALAWLERLPGVGRKVAAATLNFSTLRRPALVVDTHVLRVLRRFGFIRGTADPQAAYGEMMGVLHDWSADDLEELHILMKLLGQNICRADWPCCRNCPIRRRCRACTVR